MFTVIRDDDGDVLEEGFTPLTFEGDEGSTYTVTVADFEDREFERWDDGPTDREREVTLGNDTTITAHYQTGSNDDSNNSNLMEKLRPVTLNVLNVPVEQVMDICCRDQPVHYRIVDRIIILEEKTSPAGVTATPVKASVAEIPVSGKVTNKEGEPMVGVTVTNKRSKAAVRTQATR